MNELKNSQGITVCGVYSRLTNGKLVILRDNIVNT